MIGAELGRRQASLREHNLGMVLGRVVHSPLPPSRALIAAGTGLTRATVSALAEQLINAGLVAELAPAVPQGAGRPAVPLVPASRTLLAVGLEINVDYLGVRVLDLAGEVLAERVSVGDFRHTEPAPVLARLAELYADTVGPLLADEIPLAGCCLAVPGLVDRLTGPLRVAPNLGWKSVDVVGVLAAQGGPAKVLLANEATLAAGAEARALRPGGTRSFFYVSGEIGIGGAAVADDAVVAGRHGWAGEIGHTLINPAGPLCGCGATGCLEQYAGKDALLRLAGLDLAAPISALRERAATDPAAAQALSVGGQALGIALANIVNLLDVDTIVLGGMFTELTNALLPAIRRELDQRVLAGGWSTVAVQSAAVTDYAALTGGALRVLADVVAHPTSWMARSALSPSPRR